MFVKRPSRRAIAAAVCGVVAAVGLLMVLPRFLERHQPTYQGRGPGYWFPRWEFEPTRNPADILQRSKALAIAGPEALPLLAAVARIEERPAFQRYAALRQYVPQVISQFLLPTYREAEAIRYQVRTALKSMTAREPTLRAIAQDWDTLPDWAQRDILRWLGDSTELASISEPLLLRVLDGPDRALAAEAALALCHYPTAKSPRLAQMARQLIDLPDSRLISGKEPPGLDIALRLAELGTAGRDATPLFEHWLASGLPLLRGAATLALAAIAPDRYPLAEGVRTRLLPDPETPWSLLLTEDSIQRTRAVLPWTDLVPIVSPLLDASAPGNALPGLRRENQVLRINAILKLLDELGPQAKPALPMLLSTLTQDWTVGPKARVIARIGPIAPESIPALLPALTNMDAAPSLVLLLSGYGRAAKAAVPALRQMAEGGVLLHPSPLHPLFREDITWDRPPIPCSNLSVAAALVGDLGSTNAWPALRRFQTNRAARPTVFRGIPVQTTTPNLATNSVEWRWASNQFSGFPGPEPNHRRQLEAQPGTLRIPFAPLPWVAETVLNQIESSR